MNKNDKTDIHIKQMKFSDFSEVLSLWQKAGLNISDNKLDLQTTLAMNSSSCLVLIKDRTIIGAVLGTFNGRRGWIYHLAIHHDFQNSGYGSLLLRKAELALKMKGAHRIHLGVAYTNIKVIPFYEKYGYKIVTDALWLGKNI